MWDMKQVEVIEDLSSPFCPIPFSNQLEGRWCDASESTSTTRHSLSLLPAVGRRALIPHALENTEKVIQHHCIHILAASNDRFVAFRLVHHMQSSLSDVELLRQMPTDTLELSYFLCNQLLLNYDEEKKLFVCDSGEERIRLAYKFCRVIE